MALEKSITLKDHLKKILTEKQYSIWFPPVKINEQLLRKRDFIGRQSINDGFEPEVYNVFDPQTYTGTCEKCHCQKIEKSFKSNSLKLPPLIEPKLSRITFGRFDLKLQVFFPDFREIFKNYEDNSFAKVYETKEYFFLISVRSDREKLLDAMGIDTLEDFFENIYMCKKKDMDFYQYLDFYEYLECGETLPGISRFFTALAPNIEMAKKLYLAYVLKFEPVDLKISDNIENRSDEEPDSDEEETSSDEEENISTETSDDEIYEEYDLVRVVDEEFLKILSSD